MRLLLLVLVALAGLIQYPLWIGKGGLLSVYQLDKDVKEQQNKNIELEKRNAKIAGDVDDLRQGTRAVEERARIEHGMVKENETLVQILQSDETAPKLSKVKPSRLSEDSKLAKSTPTQ